MKETELHIEDPLRAAKGILLSCALGVVLWAAILILYKVLWAAMMGGA